MGGRQQLFCGYSGGSSFRALQAQWVICRPDKPVAHAICIKLAIGLHASPRGLFLAASGEDLSLLQKCSWHLILGFLTSAVTDSVFPTRPFTEHRFHRTCCPGASLG